VRCGAQVGRDTAWNLTPETAAETGDRSRSCSLSPPA